jgi:hypothetical protein
MPAQSNRDGENHLARMRRQKRDPGAGPRPESEPEWGYAEDLWQDPAGVASPIERSYAVAERPRARDTEVERVGGRGLIRGEFVAVAVGILFMVGALLKPWSSGPITGPTSSPTDTASASPVVVLAPTVPATATAARASDAPTASNAPRIAAVGPTVAASPQDYGPNQFLVDLQAVDWTSLSSPDTHDGWGISAVSLANVVHVPDGSRGLAPRISWTAPSPAGQTNPLLVEVPVFSGRPTYALAVTWPKTLVAKRISFTYVAPGTGGYGFAPQSELAAFDVAQVTSDGTAGARASAAVQSGQFWVAPVEKITLPFISPPAQEWRFEPWAWPLGEYKVTVTSDAGDQILTVRLEPR